MKKIKFKNNLGEVYSVFEMEDPTQLIAKETADQLAEGMVISVEIEDITYQKALDECHKNRAANYPDIGQVLEAVLEGDQNAINSFKQQRALIKLQFPKPNNFNQGNGFASNEDLMNEAITSKNKLKKKNEKNTA